MKKCTFYRTVYSGRQVRAVKTEGFCETLTDKDGNEITLCFHKASEKVWAVTEKSTGFLVCHSDKRMNALEKAKEYLDMIYEKMQQSEKYKTIISKAYEEGVR